VTIVVLLVVVLTDRGRTESYSARPPLPRWLIWSIRLAIFLALGRIVYYLLIQRGYL
jgi:hypothetical protein